MSLSRVLLALLALASVPALVSAQDGDADPRRDEPIGLQVMTFNIRTAAGRDGDDSWPFRKDLVAETIRGVDPDVIGMQEVLAEQIEFFEDALPEYRWLGVDRGLNGGTGLSEATPIFYRYAEIVPIESGTFWLGTPPDGRQTRRGGSRIVTWARFHHLETGRQIYVFNTHFTLREGPQQLESVARIRERIAALPEGSAVIVMGDFNALAEWSSTWREATSAGLRDAWDVADERRGPPFTSNGFGPPPAEGDARIDWILVSGPITVPSVATVVHSANGRYPSDHYPVAATLRIDPS
jgi:endonuclease/exonuclease/phosphatase family metal-dependent hydrolase